MIECKIKIRHNIGPPPQTKGELVFEFTSWTTHYGELYRPLSAIDEVNRTHRDGFLGLSHGIQTGTSTQWDMMTYDDRSVLIVFLPPCDLHLRIVGGSNYDLLDTAPRDLMKVIWNELIRNGFRPL